ncbi:MAG: hypothetical protein ATN35_12075 [Epulopiscium sp. Nele67-Bin004]|nr:MAG: hypothetical protein ATN35_12075 [Epulopiscium sp. Nele67-Bin004]
MKKKTAIATLLIVAIFFFIPMSITLITYNYHFDKRIYHNNNYFEYLTTLNPDFTKQEVTFPSDEGQLLSGAFYSQQTNDDPKGLLVFVHGMGVSHENYLAEIEWLTRENYVVFSYDNTGVEDCEGTSLKGLTQAPLDLQHAIQYIYSLDGGKDVPIILIGHSWGGFSVATVSQLGLEKDVDGIVTLAGFWRNINVIEDIAKIYVGDVVTLLRPYLMLYEKYLFGENSNLNGVTGLGSTNAQVMIIHSEDDPIVRYEGNFEMYNTNFGEQDRFTFVGYDDAGHKLTVNKASYERIHDIMHHQMEHDENSLEFLKLNEERLSLIGDFNYDVMNNIVEFCDRVVGDIN